MEFAFEGADLADTIAAQPSIFTGALVEGLTTGAADRDQDGVVSLGELYEYVFERVRDANPNQTPGKWEFGLQGELVLAKNPQRVIVPAPLPADLVELIENPFPGTRLGTIDVLVRLASGTNLPVAAGARQVLEQMVHDDSRGVAAAATEAMSKTGVRLSTTEVDLGTVKVDADAAAKVSLEGVPLVTASRIESSSPRLRVHRVDREIYIEVETSVPGPIEGIVSVSGPSGAASVHVAALVAGGKEAGRATKTRTQPAVKPGPVAPPAASIATSAVATPSATASEPAAQAPTDSRWNRFTRSTRVLVERGWHTGHVQTLGGAELGGLGVWWLGVASAANDAVNGAYGGGAGLVAKTSTIWIGAVIGAGVVLRLAGPPRSWRILIALVLLYPVFHGLARDSLYLEFKNVVVVAALIAVFALIAATVVRFKRPQAP